MKASELKNNSLVTLKPVCFGETKGAAEDRFGLIPRARGVKVPGQKYPWKNPGLKMLPRAEASRFTFTPDPKRPVHRAELSSTLSPLLLTLHPGLASLGLCVCEYERGLGLGH